jgi:hypothetical protein
VNWQDGSTAIETAVLPDQGGHGYYGLYHQNCSPLCLLISVRDGENGVVRIAKPLLLITTPIGLIDGFYECYKLAGGLIFLMAAMVGVLAVGAVSVVRTIRREERAVTAGPTEPGRHP